jgi:two-component system response regulator (stage 0 sporulation protein F)
VRTKWVLLVDDDSDIREAVIDFLQEAGYAARAVADGKAALELLRTDRPSLLLADFHLTDMDGKELRRRVRELLGASSPPCALLTGAELSELKDISGAILQKPIDTERLLGLVNQHCGT